MAGWGGQFFGGTNGPSGRILNYRIPKWQKPSVKFLNSLLSNDIEYPTLQVPGLNDIQTSGLDTIRKYIEGPTQDWQEGINELRKTVNGGYNALTSPEYSAYRDNSAMEEAAAINALGRSQELNNSSSNSRALIPQGQIRRGFTNDRQLFLQGLINRERDRQLGAAPTLAEMSEQEPLNRAGAAMQYGEIPRQIESQQNEAFYNALLQTMLAPYQVKGQVAQGMLSKQGSFWAPEEPLEDSSDFRTNLGGYISMLFSRGAAPQQSSKSR